jgi:hypothetical protein
MPARRVPVVMLYRADPRPFTAEAGGRLIALSHWKQSAGMIDKQHARAERRYCAEAEEIRYGF